MSAKRSSEPSPVAFWFLCRHGQRNSPPAGGEIPLRITNPIRILPPHPPPLGAPSPRGEGFGGRSPPHPSRLRRATFPPGGRLLRGTPSSVWPDGQPSFQKGEGFEGEGPSFVPGG